ncbi:MAG: hypothetical protein IKC72_00350, partial [Clostridia bacterium]|nr:hypothetical protein [Clostridia bacterium]
MSGGCGCLMENEIHQRWMKSCYAGFGVGRGFTPAVIPPPVILSEAKNLTCYQTIFLRPDPSHRSRMTP